MTTQLETPECSRQTPSAVARLRCPCGSRIREEILPPEKRCPDCGDALCEKCCDATKAKNPRAALQEKLLKVLRDIWGQNVGMTALVSSLFTISGRWLGPEPAPVGRGHFLLHDAMKRHFALTDHVAHDLIISSITVADIAEKLAELKGLAEPSLFSASPATNTPINQLTN